MICLIPNIIPQDLLERVRRELAEAEWVDGVETAGQAAEVKRNHQAKATPPIVEVAQAVATAAILNDRLQLFALPHSLSRPMFSKYEAGDAYGPHIDNPLMGGGMRADLSVTIYLSDPATYEGGLLEIEGEPQPGRVAGSAVIYPTTSVHQVSPVTRGTRLAAVFWIQSSVRDTEKRAILADLTHLHRWAKETHGRSPEALRLSQLRANLLRLWLD